MSNSLAVLVCPLDWGIGHATRCVPVIRKFLEKGFRVTLAADGRALDFLKSEFPDCKAVRFPGTRINYTTRRLFALKMLFLSPRLLLGIFIEHRRLKKLIQSERPDIIFSDNRYGLWNKNVRSVFMTHQLNIIPPGKFRIFAGLINSILHYFIGKFDECWVPDFENPPDLAGLLSHPSKIQFPVHYVGILSRFIPEDHIDKLSNDYSLDFMIILSGPEPQRTLFERIILQNIQGTELKGIIVRGRPEESEAWDPGKNIRVLSHLDTQKMREYILGSKLVICRSGYSSIMDLVTLGKKAVLVPTPGQTEQEYLARYLQDKKMFFTMSQEDFDLGKAIKMSPDFAGMRISGDQQVLEERMKFLKQA